MKSILGYTFIALISFVIGYFTYPTLNPLSVVENTNAVATESNKNLADETNDELVNFDKGPVVEGDENSKVLEDETIKVTSNSSSEALQQTSKTVSSINPPKQVTNNSMQTQALQEWGEQHNSELEILIATHMPTDIAPHMLEQVKLDNQFLSSPEIKQPLAQDNLWAYNKEQELKAYIARHELADKFELLNVSCKQLMCDVLGLEQEPQAWIKIFFSMFKNITNMMTPNESQGAKAINYVNGDGSTSIYFQLKFHPE